LGIQDSSQAVRGSRLTSVSAQKAERRCTPARRVSGIVLKKCNPKLSTFERDFRFGGESTGGRLSKRAIPMTPASVVLSVVLFGLSYLVAPTTLVLGWARWINQRPRLWTISSALSFVGFLFASASALLALCVILYAEGGGFEHTGNNPVYSPSTSPLYRCVRQGVALSLLGIACSIGGVWRRSPFRWQAPASAVGTLVFWLLATNWP